MRASSYNIYVPLDSEDHWLLVHGYTGAVDRVTGLVVRYLWGERGTNEAPSDATLEALSRRGYLTAQTEEEETTHLIRLATALHERHCQGAVFLFAPTLRCQFRCVYCFETAVVQRSELAPGVTMTNEQVDAAYQAIELILAEKKKDKPRDLTLYGGEPLLAENRSLVTYIVDQGVGRGFRFRAITNGHDLNAYRRLLSKDRIGYLQITLDGPERIHDRRRRGKGGKPTFRSICENVDMALSQGCTVVLRTNVDRDNADSLAELAAIYHARGWDALPNFYPYAHVVYGPLNRDVQMRPTELLTRGELLADELGREGRMIGFDFGITQIFAGLLRNGRLPTLRPYYCGSNVGSYIFAPDGNIYTCWDTVGVRGERIGVYFPELQWDSERAQNWIDRNIANMPICQKCPWALLCGGGCAYQARESTGSLFSAYCFEFQETFLRIVPRVYREWMRRRAASESAPETQRQETVPCA